ncbi:hypothetical protein [Natrarchaeobius versutus]|uniref:hypothetical protein n=1 Tax=Natrarchaeobius versutus TaxID=1679078 RepID=UPI00350FD9ED
MVSKSTANRVAFVGRDGVRRLWSLLLVVTMGLCAVVFLRVEPAFSLLYGVVAVLSAAGFASGRFRTFVDENRWTVFGSLLLFVGIVLATVAISS